VPHPCCWQETDREAFAVMNADAEVMRDLGEPISREQSDQKRDGYAVSVSSTRLLPLGGRKR